MAALGISQPTLSRLVASRRDELVVLGRARSVRYGARDVRSAFSAGLPIYRVRTHGRVEQLGTVVPLASGQSVLLRQDAEASVFVGLPWFIEELRPEGFLGRLVVKALPAALQLPRDARIWTSEQLLRALAYGGEDQPGDLLIGRDAYDRYLRQRLADRIVVEREDYPRILEAQLAGELPGSSAGGEQPKLMCVRAASGTSVPLLVKYSPPFAESAAARRWADLLRCEHLALEVLRNSGYAAAQSAYVEQDGRAYLEVVRFDRSAAGRVAVVTGRFVDAEFVGSGAWVPLAEGLVRQRLLPEADAELVRFAHYFGGLIGNTDMHLGNIAFFTDDYRTFRLAPFYDMLPMALRPTAQGELPRTEAPCVHPTPEDAEIWLRATHVALAFFERVLAEPSLDPSLHGFAAERLTRTRALKNALAAIV